MPTIYLPKRKTRLVSPYKKDDISQSYYNTPQWKNLRNSYIREHPLCEVCLMLGILGGEMNIRAAEEIHHVTPFLTRKDDKGRRELLLDPNNLIALCRKHHRDIHAHRVDLPLLEDELWDKEHKDRRDLIWEEEYDTQGNVTSSKSDG